MIKSLLSIFAIILSLQSFAYGSSTLLDEMRVLRALDTIRDNINFQFRKYYFITVLDNDKSLDVSVVGVNIVITTGLLNILNNRQLLAVVAHEVSHREHHHFFSRMGYMVGGAVLSVFDHSLHDDYTDRIGEFNKFVVINQELQADCDAYNWLKELEQKGFDASPNDLRDALETVARVDLDWLLKNNPKSHTSIRYQAIKQGHSSKCEF